MVLFSNIYVQMFHHNQLFLQNSTLFYHLSNCISLESRSHIITVTSCQYSNFHILDFISYIRFLTQVGVRRDAIEFLGPLLFTNHSYP